MNRRANVRGCHPSFIIVIGAFGLASTVAVAQNDASLRAGANALLAIDQHRASVVERIVTTWGVSLAQSSAYVSVDDLRTLLLSLRADQLLAAALAGTLDGVREVIDKESAPVIKPDVGQLKALGDIAIDLVYTPVTPCRLVETRGTFAAVYQGNGTPAHTPAPFGSNEIRSYAVQGGNGVCLGQLPVGLVSSAVQLQVFGLPTTPNSGDIEILPQGSTFGNTATMVYIGSIPFNTVSTTAKINLANNQISMQVRGGGANVAIDIVGYFKRPGNYDGVHTITGTDATDSGGLNNTSSANFSTVAGGDQNVASGNSSTVSGGTFNSATGGGSTVAGGIQNMASGNSSTVSGGFVNTASGSESIVAGGVNNVASGDHTFAAGSNAHAVENGEFVWADTTGSVFDPQIATHGWGPTFAANTFNARATGGVWFVTGVDVSFQPTTSVFVNPGSGTWSSTSDRAVKENFHAIDPAKVLAKVAAMPIESWNYISEAGNVRHLGPVSQDFWTAFRLGPNDRTITNVDEAGVALAAIQGLHQLMQQKDAEITSLKRKLEAIEAKLGM